MTLELDEAIKHAEEVAKQQEEMAWEAELQEEYEKNKNCKECAEDHRQLAEWLKELKKLREQITDRQKVRVGVLMGMDDVVKYVDGRIKEYSMDLSSESGIDATNRMIKAQARLELKLVKGEMEKYLKHNERKDEEC